MHAYTLFVVIIISCFCSCAEHDVKDFFLAEAPVTSILVWNYQKRRTLKQMKTDYQALVLVSTAIALVLSLEGAWSSIAGVTYMDALDFQQRYRDVHECDPFYWHPLHLPEECADMYERLIRARLSAASPVRVLKHRTDPLVRYTDHNTYHNYHFYPHQYPVILESPSLYPSVIEIPVEPEKRHLSPYEKMLVSVRKDVKNQPSFPSVQILPYFGAVALYHQPISSKSAMMITHLSRTYAGAARDAPSEYDIINNGDDHKKKEKKDKINKMGKMVQKVLQRGKTKKSVKGNIVTL